MKYRIFSLYILISFLTVNKLFSNEKDSIYTVNSYSNTIYLGIDNYIKIPADYFNESIYFVTTDNGIIFQDSLFFNIIPKKLPVANITIFKYSSEDTILIRKKRFFVKYVPNPCVLVGTKCIDEIKYLDRNKLIENPVFNIYISNDIKGSQQWMKIKRFSLGYVYGSVYKSFESENNMLTPEMIREIKQLKPGQEISIKMSIESSGGLVKHLPVYTLIVF